MFGSIRRLTCALLGHSWAPRGESRRPTFPDGRRFLARCLRCRAVAKLALDPAAVPSTPFTGEGAAASPGSGKQRGTPAHAGATPTYLPPAADQEPAPLPPPLTFMLPPDALFLDMAGMDEIAFRKTKSGWRLVP